MELNSEKQKLLEEFLTKNGWAKLRANHAPTL